MPSAPPLPLPRALVFNSNSFTIGKHSLTDDIIIRAGMENLATTLGIDRYGQISLETVVSSQVDVLILSSYRDGPPAIASEVLHHPVLEAISNRTQLTVVPAKLWVCAGPENLDAIDFLRGVATEVRREAASR
jgi:iron complex transport system substrate-binding protein